MSPDQEEWLVRLQFLEEAQEYLDSIESALLGLSNRGVDGASVDAILRAAHSIKGGAAMMGFEALSQLAHRLEDFFKILQAGRTNAIDPQVERLFLTAVDGMRKVASQSRQRQAIPETWLQRNLAPVFKKLREHLGDLQPEDQVAALSAEAGLDMRSLMFETEVDSCLQRLEAVLAEPDHYLVREEFTIAAQELGGLGEMLELEAFQQLCGSIVAGLEGSEVSAVEAIAQTALQTLRRSQALVLIGQIGALPNHLALAGALPSQPTTAEPAIEPTRLERSEAVPQDLPDVWSDFDLAASETLELPVPEQMTATVTASAPAPTPASVADLPLDSPAESIVALTDADVSAELSAELPATSTTAVPQESSLRVAVRQLDYLGEMFGELTTDRNGLTLQLRHLKTLVTLLRQRVRTLETTNGRLRNAYDRAATQVPALATTGVAVGGKSVGTAIANPPMFNFSSGFDLLELDRYSDVHLLAQEIIESVVQIQEVTNDIETSLDETEGASRSLSRTARQLQVGMTQVRMRPLSEITSRFSRVLRDLSLTYNKTVELRIRGGGTLIERSILEALQDPLMHLFRNAFDHGIETPEARIQRGKPQQGLIEISASYRGNQTIITIQDDGGGIPLDKVRQKALKMGLTPADLDACSEAEILDLIFEPGFSTASEVTALSGRGVGMDVVRTNLRQIRGEIQVETVPGQGTTFTLTVPHTLSVTRVLVVENQGMLLAFPANIVEEMQLLDPTQIRLAADQELLEWQGYTVPLIRMGRWLKFNRPQPRWETESRPTIDRPVVLVVTQGEAPYAIQCDRYWGEQEVTTRSVEGNIKLTAGFSGCVVLGDGRVVPLVEIESLLGWLLQNHSPTLGSTPPLSTLLSQRDSTRPTIMVVDDSINVRRFLALTLEKAGYRTEQAKDGQDAVEKLQSGLLPAAVICDVEMPRLDGFGFLAQAKTLPQCQNLPIVMLTSRSGQKHRQLALNLGAVDYFSKPFRQQELLQRLETLTTQ